MGPQSTWMHVVALPLLWGHGSVVQCTVGMQVPESAIPNISGEKVLRWNVMGKSDGILDT